jgi:hypothetical protein
MNSGYRAAWVPDDDPQRPWDDAAALAADWIWAQADDISSTPMLVTFSFQNGERIDALQGLEHVTTRSPGSVTGLVGRPVLAYVPEARTLALAHRHARNAALCVVESVSFPLHGWAREVGAVNLLNGDRLQRLDSFANELLEHLQFIGNNGWGDQFGKRDATCLLPSIREHVDRAEVLGYVLAHGAHDRSVTNLEKIMDKLHWT